jgi:hypothetical protein
VAIVGLVHERWGEAPHAFVVLKEGARADERELREFARTKLAHFKAPQSVTFVKELPKTATAKIQKCILRGQLPAIAVVCPLDKHSATLTLNEKSPAAFDGSTFQLLALRRSLFQELIRRATQRTLFRPDRHDLPFGLGSG